MVCSKSFGFLIIAVVLGFGSVLFAQENCPPVDIEPIQLDSYNVSEAFEKFNITTSSEQFAFLDDWNVTVAIEFIAWLYNDFQKVSDDQLCNTAMKWPSEATSLIMNQTNQAFLLLWRRLCLGAKARFNHNQSRFEITDLSLILEHNLVDFTKLNQTYYEMLLNETKVFRNQTLGLSTMRRKLELFFNAQIMHSLIIFQSLHFQQMKYFNSKGQETDFVNKFDMSNVWNATMPTLRTKTITQLMRLFKELTDLFRVHQYLWKRLSTMEKASNESNQSTSEYDTLQANLAGCEQAMRRKLLRARVVLDKRTNEMFQNYGLLKEITHFGMFSNKMFWLLLTTIVDSFGFALEYVWIQLDQFGYWGPNPPYAKQHIQMVYPFLKTVYRLPILKELIPENATTYVQDRVIDYI